MRPSKRDVFCNVAAALTLLISSFSVCAIAQSSEHLLHVFTNFPNCLSPAAPLIADAAGNLYGTTFGGGAYGGGCFFEIAQPYGSWEIYDFGEGMNISAALVLGKSGNLYGVAQGGGPYTGGVAFELSPSADGGWIKTVLHNFGNVDDGSSPQSNLIFDDAGNLYGTTVGGGGRNREGTVYRLSPGDGGWNETILHVFPLSPSGPDGCAPAGGVVMDREGRLYGNTQVGGAYGDGAVYELSPYEGGYREKVIYSFNGHDGLQPSSGLTMDRSGNLYGMTGLGGEARACNISVGCGIVFELIKGANGNWSEKVLHAMEGDDGAGPVGPIVFDPAGNLYAAARAGGIDNMGSVFSLTPTPTGEWRETVLHRFDFQPPDDQDGEFPVAGVIFERGRVLGTTGAGGGITNSGTVFEITPATDADF
jgi:uncharacterized repeat protein (TIGR03803 family)